MLKLKILSRQISKRLIGACLEKSATRSIDGLFPHYQLMGTEHLPSPSDTSSIAILIQGPVVSSKTWNQLVETCSLYRTFFPHSEILLSTWLGHFNGEAEARLASLGVHTVRSADPGGSFLTNALRQQTSTLAGLDWIDSSTSAEYVLKTRVDQRLLSSTVPHSLLELTSLSENRHKVFGSSYGTGALRIYGLTDQLQFGNLDVLREYWSKDSLKVERDSLVSAAPLELREHARKALDHAPEILLNSSFLSRRGWKLEWTWADNLKAFDDNFGILDSQDLMHVHLQKKTNRADHVTFATPFDQRPIERHLNEATFKAYLSLKDTWSPSLDEIVSAFKIPTR